MHKDYHCASFHVLTKIPDCWSNGKWTSPHTSTFRREGNVPPTNASSILLQRFASGSLTLIHIGVTLIEAGKVLNCLAA